MMQARQLRDVQAGATDFHHGFSRLPCLAHEILQAEVRQAGMLVAKGQCRQLALADHGGLPEFNTVPHVIEERCQRLARRPPIQPMPHATRLPHQPRRLQQRLHIQHDVILGGPQPLFQRPALGAHLARPPRLAPAAVRDFDDFIDGRVPRGDLGKRFLDDPVNLCVRHMPGNIGDCRKHVD
ncbi:hypothetical protein D3C72_1567260 [compost metagenome]